MATSANEPVDEKHQEISTSQAQQNKLQEEWISEEELFTEGSSDEDDMALRMKRRERREGRIDNKPFTSLKGRSTEAEVDSEATSGNSTNELVVQEQEQHDDNYKWRPTQGSFKLKQISEPNLTSRSKESSAPGGGGAVGAVSEQSHGSSVTQTASASTTASTLSLSEAYSNMHKLDALLRDSDRRLKEAQAETLRAQLSTRAQLQELRERVGAQNVVLATNWDAFMRLCPAAAVEPDPKHGRGLGTRGRALYGAKCGEAGAGDQGYSVLPRINGSESDQDSDDSGSSGSALAITDEEKLKLAALLQDVDVDVDVDMVDQGADQGLLGAYNLDTEARRSLDHIDGKLQELIPETAEGFTRGPRAATGVGGSRQQRLIDINRCLQDLAASALDDVEPVGDEQVRALLEGARGEDAEHAGLADPAVISGLLDEVRQQLPRFRYRHREAEAQSQGRPEQGLPQHAVSR